MALRASIKRFLRALVLAVALCGATSVFAEVKQSSADGFLISFSAPVAATPSTTYADVVQIQRWWNGEHTFSGKSSNLSLKAEAGGCFCEKWSGGSVEHGRVIMALPGKVLRLDAALGPLQEFALKGILSFWIKTEDSATTLTVEYRVNGASASALDTFAPSVDDVLGMQVDRLRRFIATGNPEPPPDPSAGDKSAKPAPGAKPAKPKPRSAKPDVPAKQ